MKTFRYILLALFCLTLLLSCSGKQSQKTLNITISGTFEQNCIVQIRLWNIEFSKHTLSNIHAIKGSGSPQTVILQVPDNNFRESGNIEFIFSQDHNQSAILEYIEVETIGRLSGIKLFNGISWTDIFTYDLNDANPDLVNFHTPANHDSSRSKSITLKTFSFYQAKHATAIAVSKIIFFLFIAVLFVMLIRSTKQPLLVLAFGLYVASFIFKISITNWALILLVLAIAIDFFIRKNRKISVNTAFYGLAILFAFICIGLLYTIDFEGGMKELPTTSILILFPVLFSITLLHSDSIERILHFFIRLSIAYCLLVTVLFCYTYIDSSIAIESILSYAKSNYPFLLVRPFFDHPSFISVILSMAIPAAAYLKFGTQTKVSWLELLASVILVAGFSLLTGARIGIVVVIILVCLSALVYVRLNAKLKLAVVLAGGIAISIGFFKVPAIKNKLDDPIRDSLRKTAIAAFGEKPIAGWGTGSMTYMLNSSEIAEKAGLEKPLAQEYNHFHSQYLDQTVQFGVIGLLFFAALFIYLIYNAIRYKDFLLMAYLAIYLVFMAVESPFATVKGMQPMIFWMCFLLCTQKNRLLNNNKYKE